MVRIEPCATTVRSGHVVVRKKRRSSMARLKEAACSTSFCFFFHFFFLLLLLFCETLSSTGLKTQRERKRKKKPFFGSRLSLSFSLVFETMSSKKFSLREKEREKKLKLFVIFLFVSRYRLVNELIIVMVIIMINRILI